MGLSSNHPWHPNRRRRDLVQLFQHVGTKLAARNLCPSHRFPAISDDEIVPDQGGKTALQCLLDIYLGPTRLLFRVMHQNGGTPVTHEHLKP